MQNHETWFTSRTHSSNCDGDVVISLDNGKFRTIVYGSLDVWLDCIFELPCMPHISLLPCIAAVHTLVAMLYLANYKKAVIFIV